MNVIKGPEGQKFQSRESDGREGRESVMHQPLEQSQQGPASIVQFERKEAPHPSTIHTQTSVPLKTRVQSNNKEGVLARVKQRLVFVYERAQDLFKGLPANLSVVRYFVQAFLDKSQTAQPPVPVSA